MLPVGFSSIPGPLQTVQRAELWGLSFLFKACCFPVCIGIDNSHVLLHETEWVNLNLYLFKKTEISVPFSKAFWINEAGPR